MLYSTITKNIIKTAKTSTDERESISIFYNGYSPVFDAVLKESKKINIFYDTISSTDESLFGYDLYWNNNPLVHTERIDYVKFRHLKDVVFFHEFPDANLKKEDRFLINQALINSIKICPDDMIQKAWGLSSSYHISYGLPKTTNSVSGKTNSVGIITHHKNDNQVEILNSYLKQSSISSDIVKFDEYASWDEISEKLNPYKICIVLTNHIDILASLSCACKVITPISLKENYVANITDFSNIIELTKKLLESYDHTDAQNNREKIINKYSFEEFEIKILALLKQIIKEPFLL
jgi:hypothetical protein